MSSVENSHLKITFAEIESATNNFETVIGEGGFGKVYKGELSISGVLTPVAVKRLSIRLHGQGLKEYLTEIQLLSQCEHRNLISLLAYCDEGNEKVLVYEYAEHGSLDRHLGSANMSNNLTWMQRLNICLGAARGLGYLHREVGAHHRVIHRDIKSANILLDHNWEAKIADLGLSRIGLANQNNSIVISNVCGTPGYCDPEYQKTGVLTKESDVYSFGVVLFEVLCGRMNFMKINDERQFLSILAPSYFEANKLPEIVDPKIKEQVDPNSFNKFADIAYQCLLSERRQRPLMSVVVEELEEALEFQKKYEFKKQNELERLESDSEAMWEAKLPRDYEEIIKKLKPNLVCNSKKELFSLLHKGIVFDFRGRMFSIDEYGEKCEMIAAKEFLDPMFQKKREHDSDSRFYTLDVTRNRLFSVAVFRSHEHNVRCHVRTSLLSLGIMYVASLVFTFRNYTNVDFEPPKVVVLKWKYEDMDVVSTTPAEYSEDGWLKVEMWKFSNHKKNAEFEFFLQNISDLASSKQYGTLIEGIEFRPINSIGYEKDEGLKDKLDGLSISDEDEHWEQKLPKGYRTLIQRSVKPVDSANMSKKELYFLFCEGILHDNGKKWVSLCGPNNGQRWFMPMTCFYSTNQTDADIVTLAESRFGEAVRFIGKVDFDIRTKVWAGAAYAWYLVFKYQHCNSLDFDLLKVVCYLDGKHHSTRFVYLKLYGTNIPTIKAKNDKRSHDSVAIPKINESRTYLKEGWMQQRKDGWLEFLLWKTNDGLGDNDMHSLKMNVMSLKPLVTELTVEGVEFRPI